MHIQEDDLVEWSFAIYGTERGAKRGRARIVENGWVVIQNLDVYAGEIGFHTMREERLEVVERGHLSIVANNTQYERVAA